MKKILIFGSNGLVGNSLRRKFRDKKYNVFYSTREDTNLFSFEETNKKIKSYKPDIIINAAAKVGGINANNTQRTEFLVENLKINLNILESCIDMNDLFIINLGSSCIYPLNAENPINEESIMSGKLEPTNSPYAMAKLTAIELANSLNLQYGHKVVNLMPTNLYGPYDNFSEMDSHVIPGLLFRMHSAKIKSENEFKIWGTGNPMREFMYVDDLADSILFLLEKKPNYSLINVGSGYEISIKNLAEEIKNIIKFEGNLTFDTSMPDGNPRKLLDSSKINHLGWKAKTDIKTGLEKTYDWFLENIKL